MYAKKAIRQYKFRVSEMFSLYLLYLKMLLTTAVFTPLHTKKSERHSEEEILNVSR